MSQQRPCIRFVPLVVQHQDSLTHQPVAGTTYMRDCGRWTPVTTGIVEKELLQRDAIVGHAVEKESH